MANPYKKAEQVQKKAPGSRQEPAKVEEVKVAPVQVEEAKPVEPEVKTTVAPVVAKEPVADIFDGMVEQKPKAKSYGFYLDDEVVEALEKLAKQKKISKSKVLNTILRNVLIK
jgi:hypothetical protein